MNTLESHVRSQEKRRLIDASTVAWATLLLLSSILVLLDRPPAPLSSHAPNSAFSAQRAIDDVAIIAKHPHPINSPDHDRVRDYIVERMTRLGAEVRVQKTHDTSQAGATNLENIVCRVRGSGTDKAVLVVAHYDSVSTGPGASDDSVAVAAMFESLRALRQTPLLRRDLIFLFSDGEEAGLLGAKAFIAGDPWAHDVGVVLNFEARGIGGPSIMFETSDQNQWLIKQLAIATPFPVANSLSFEIYKRLPNDTDFTVFKRAGYSGLNFAFIDGLAYYHSPLDSVANVNLASLQHQGDYMLALTRQFGNAAIDDPKVANSVYFDILGRYLVVYSQTVSFVLILLLSILMALCWYCGFSSGHLRIRRLPLAFSSAVLALAAAVLLAVAASRATSSMASGSMSMAAGLMFDPGWYVLAFCFFGMAGGMAIIGLFSGRVTDAEQAMANLSVCYLFVALTAYYLPAGAYLFEWPLLFSLVGWLLIFRVRHLSRRDYALLLAPSVLPAFILMVPMAHKIFFAFSFQSAVVVVVIGMLLVFLSSGVTLAKQIISGRTVATLLLMLAVGLFLVALVESRADQHLLKESSVDAASN